jgi:hypothetical protein
MCYLRLIELVFCGGRLMRRRALIATLGGMAGWPLIAQARQPTKPLIGFFDVRSPEAMSDRLVAFQFHWERGLRNDNYVRKTHCH